MALYNTLYKPVYAARTVEQTRTAVEIVTATTVKVTILIELDKAFLDPSLSRLPRARSLTGFVLTTSAAVQRKAEITEDSKELKRLDQAAAVLATLAAEKDVFKEFFLKCYNISAPKKDERLSREEDEDEGVGAANKQLKVQPKRKAVYGLTSDSSDTSDNSSDETSALSNSLAVHHSISTATSAPATRPAKRAKYELAPPPKAVVLETLQKRARMTKPVKKVFQIRRKIAEAKVVKKVSPSQTLTSEDCQQLLKVDVVIHKLLGKGGQAGVYLSENIKTGQTFALKRLLADTPGQDHYSQIEIGNTMRLEGCEHIVRYVRYFITPNGIRWLFLELARSDLQQLVCSNKLSMGMVSNLTVQMIKAVRAAHENGVSHRDIKMPNFLVFDGAVVKLADFGLSKQVSSPFQVTTTCCGTPGYTAPELKFDRPIVYRPYPVDIWALACTIYEVAFARQIQSQAIVQQDILRLRASSNEASRALGFLLWSCFRTNAADRPTIEQLETNFSFTQYACSQEELARHVGLWIEPLPTSPIGANALVDLPAVPLIEPEAKPFWKFGQQLRQQLGQHLVEVLAPWLRA